MQCAAQKAKKLELIKISTSPLELRHGQFAVLGEVPSPRGKYLEMLSGRGSLRS